MQVLNNGASSTQIDKLEQIINHKLPEEFKEFYQIHDGQNIEDEALIVREQLLSIDTIIDQWTVWDDLLEQFKETHALLNLTKA